MITDMAKGNFLPCVVPGFEREVRMRSSQGGYRTCDEQQGEREHRGMHLGAVQSSSSPVSPVVFYLENEKDQPTKKDQLIAKKSLQSMAVGVLKTINGEIFRPIMNIHNS